MHAPYLGGLKQWRLAIEYCISPQCMKAFLNVGTVTELLKQKRVNEKRKSDA
jgi:hypothetical protein